MTRLAFAAGRAGRLFALLLLLLLPMLALAVPDTWGPAPSLSTPRRAHTATLLPSGKVLVIGGITIGGALRNTDIYDPVAHTWTRVGDMAQARYTHTATLLPNGKVLVVGGGTSTAMELFDPASNTWSSAGSTVTMRAMHTATLLPSGKVLIAGGVDMDGETATAELYDPAGNSWSAAASMPLPRRNHAAVLLPSGRVLLTGGNDSNGNVATAQIYNPATNTWAAAASMASARINHSLTVLADGQVLAAGGGAISGFNASAERYNPVSNTWSPAGSLSSARQYHSATLLPSGRVLVSGGASATSTAGSQIYDTASNSWTTTGSLAAARSFHTATLLADGTVLAVGGAADVTPTLASAEIFDPGASRFAVCANLSLARGYQAAALLPDGRVLVAGGESGATPRLSSAEIYNPSTNTFSITASMTSARANHAAVLLGTGRILVAGGDSAGNTSEIYDPAVSNWASAGTLAVARPLPAGLALLANGKVLIAGGTTTSNAAELYDPALNGWSGAGSMSRPRVSPTATLLLNGKVLVASDDSADVYDPAGNSWSPTPLLATALARRAAVLLPSGEVLLIGGTTDNATGQSTVVRYNPAGNSWSTAASLLNARHSANAVLLASGKVLVSGGSNVNPVQVAELYDPQSNTWSAVGTATGNHLGASLTLLPNGEALTLGSAGGSTRCDRFTPDPLALASRRASISGGYGPVDEGDTLNLSGSNFTGDSEAGSGSTNSSPTNYTLLQWQRVDNGQIVFTAPAAASARSATSYQTAALPRLPAGPYALRALVNGVLPATAPLVQVLPRLTVTPSISAGTGTISPSLPQDVAQGDSIPFVLTPGSNFHIGAVTGSCGGSLAGSTFTTAPVLTDCSVIVRFDQSTFTLTYTAGANGSISGLTPQIVANGANGSPVSAVAATGYHFAQWSDGSTANPRTDGPVTQDLSVSASFARNSYAVTSSVAAGGHGNISPASQNVLHGDSAGFTVTPDPGYSASLSGTTCSATQGSGNSWSTGPISSACHVIATFTPLPAPVLGITLSDNREHLRAGQSTTYIVTLSNTGNATAGNVALSSAAPAELDPVQMSWTCSGAGSGASCPASGSGPLNTSGVVLPAGRTLTWQVSAVVRSNTTADFVEYSVSADDNGGTPVTAADRDWIVLFRNGFELP
ncbi:kelch repeat-containing protein [Tahibacter harae]|uniref:Bacterial repeat domain-containing protein n=1 Tax=Tahibacter harae TaxID=2963937 RepID=A0ABT1QWF9_9GAMM|nr:kelch repeat-containing protein [Tahibacter harae]MCQ4166627.1 hypothetical protein [Tahibacter harae]